MVRFGFQPKPLSELKITVQGINSDLGSFSSNKMETFIAFFDVLGFKEFIYNNELGEAKRLFNHLLRDSQTALSGENYVEINKGLVVPDLSKQKVNCLHVSDSIVFWTNDTSEESFDDLVEVCYTFYWRSLEATFPLRGCLTFGEIEFKPHTFEGDSGTTFYNYSLFGKGLVDAYIEADSFDFAGCVISDKVMDKIKDVTITRLISEQKICVYKVPYKNGESYEHVFRPLKGAHNEVSFRNTVRRIKELFTYSSKADISSMPESVRRKLNNTIDFIQFFRAPDQSK